MGNEAIVTIVMRMRDEASAQIKSVTDNIVKHRKELRELATGAAYVGVSFVAMGAALKQIDNPMAQTGANVLMLVGGILSFIGTAGYFVIAVSKIINVLRTLAITQALVQALSGPVGWAQVGIGIGVAAAAAGGIYALTRNSGNGPSPTNVIVNTPAFMGSKSDARKFATEVQYNTRTSSRLGR